MKKLYIALIAFSLTYVSCNMELVPEGEIRDTEALKTVSDCESFTRGLYAMMRTITAGDNIVLSDIQLDDFHAVIGNGNRRMEFYNGAILPSTAEVSSIYASYYSAISEINFFLDNVAPKLDDEQWSDNERASIYNGMGVAHFLRAFCYNSLADKFCESYKNSSDTELEGKGLSLQLSYSPTADNTKYPGRSSLHTTYSQILSDLDSALKELTISEDLSGSTPSCNSIYITTDAVLALQARVYLSMGEDAKALTAADAVISSNRYPLTERNAHKTLWVNDMGSEVIWAVDADYTYHGSATGDAFASNTSKSDYLPTHECIYLFDENDVRWNTWFDEKEYLDGDTKTMMCRFVKYPGNPSLYAATASSNFVNIAKPFRSAELYLIAAEACQNLGKEENAIQYLTALESARINSKSIIKNLARLSGTELIEEIRNERHRELIGEGFRIADLKRWNIGFTRGQVYENHEGLIVSNFVNQHYDAGDYRLCWPIPQHELDANPQLKGQQNNGY